MKTRRIVAVALPVVAIGAVALAGGFADASADLDVLAVGETHHTVRADVTVRRAWVSNYRPDEYRGSGEHKRRLFVEIDFTARGYESEGIIDGDSLGPGAAPQLLLAGRAPQKFKVVSDAATWESRFTAHPDVPERVVLELEWPERIEIPDQVRLQLEDFRVDESHLILKRVWAHEPAAYVDVPLGPEPPQVTR